MVDVWEDNEKLSSKFVYISKAEVFFISAAIIFHYADENSLTFVFLFIAWSIAMTVIIKRLQYERRKNKKTSNN